MKTKKSISLSAGLVVPVDITVLCVGTMDQHDNNQGTSNFAGATTSFENITLNGALMGTKATRDLTESPLHQLEQGIHLHWALPDALTKGTRDKQLGKTTFPTAPNRWLLSRVVIKNGIPARKTWIIESDAVGDNGVVPENSYITLPVKQVSATDNSFRYVGIPSVFTPKWKENPDPYIFKDLTGYELSGVSNGEASFAAFYPNCRSIFGFYDDMSDVVTSDDIPVDVMYQLTGWYGNPLNDPLHGGMDFEKLQSKLGWTFENSDATPEYSLYNGLVESIGWNPSINYIVNQPLQKHVEATVSIGNNSPETFSAYFQNQYHPGDTFFEELLNSFQMGLLNDFAQPSADQWASILESMHQKKFSAFNAGTIYLITAIPSDKSVITKNARDSNGTDFTIPLYLENSLNLLNIYQQQSDFYLDYINGFKWQLFSDWYRLINADDDPLKNDLMALVYNRALRTWPVIDGDSKVVFGKLNTQLDLVNDQINTLNQESETKVKMQLKSTPASRYWQPNEPVVSIISDELKGRRRFGKSNNSDELYLVCRITDQLLQSILVNTKLINGSQFSSINLPSPNNLPYPDLCNTLLQEACLLNTNIVSFISGITPEVLQENLEKALDNIPQSVYVFTGSLPDEKAVQWWNGNLWAPILLVWRVNMYPLQPTTNKQNSELVDYPENFFTANYQIMVDEGASVDYDGTINPDTLVQSLSQQYVGSAILNPSAADSFKNQLDEYLLKHSDDTLIEIRDALASGGFMSLSLNGFNNSLLMKEQGLQLGVDALADTPYYDITTLVSPIIATNNQVAPKPNGYYNPIRAGYATLTSATDARDLPAFSIVDVYGQRRSVDIKSLLCSDSMTTVFKKEVEKGIVYFPPRLAQPGRLLFRWLAATGNELQEMNSHPLTTPVCGWLMPNHLDAGSLFFYDQEGKSLGTMYLNGEQTAIMWQSAPGDNITIDKTIGEVFAYQNVHLKDFALSLFRNTPAFFIAVMNSIDTMHNFVNPQNYAQNSDLAILVGRPIAITQVMLRLEIEGGPSVNQSWLSVKKQEYDAVNGFTEVEFPVILGDLKQINDGLIGYFKESGKGYDFSTFYTEATKGNDGVVKPVPTTLTLTTSPKVDASNPVDLMKDAIRVLVLMDPRASINASMGILPTKSISIPADQYTDILSTLEMTFLTAPVLRGPTQNGDTGFNIPLPKEAGYQWSWVEEIEENDVNIWNVTSGLTYVTNQALAVYSPQSINEGWLRLNPELLAFSMVDSSGNPVAKAGASNTLYLKMKNKKSAVLQLTPGVLIPEGETNSGSIFYIHFSNLVAQEDISSIHLKAANWNFKVFQDTQYGFYWAATPAIASTMNPSDEIVFTLSDVMTESAPGQVQTTYDYYGMTGVNDGVDNSIITLVL